ncbi:hypothetical protein niasHS_005023 [Heterodera schachtii]|uniref:B30.2/SPRY domain-containing protein n=1 Tax=Heterodera schachtii TaxID=97005 RepID=A0ABD2JKI0_HETSC
MSISTNSTNYGDDFSSAENGEVNGDAISLDIGDQFYGKNNETPIIDQQQLKEFREKFAKMEMELKMAKLEVENKEQKLKLQEMMVEQKALKEKMEKIEQKKEKNTIFPNLSTSEEMSVLIARIAELNRANTVEPSLACSCDLFGQDGNAIAADQLTKILEKISEMEKQQKQQNENTTKATAEEQFSQLQNDQKKLFEKISEMEKQQKQQNENTTKATADQFSKMQNDQKILLGKFNELEKEQKLRKALLNFRQNYWDANAFQEELQIIGYKNLTVQCNGNDCGWCFVFAKHSILLNNNSSDIFYYEISVENKKNFMIFGFAVKQPTQYERMIIKSTHAYDSHGNIWINGERKERNAQYSYGVGDTVGIGVNSSNRQIIFTKNGLRLDFSDFFVAPSFADDSFYPFVSLLDSDDKIEANFGLNFRFNLATL